VAALRAEVEALRAAQGQASAAAPMDIP
jgi:hypothetical protein